ncbi:hypothetical protein DUNSADRAFT_11277 [Dunaliella salina]|uniref:Encoded protein n=1 Tax=Dunaliella salina TaxID=3046 RepID=A0ABQ7GDP7_DUNSA|nr:hypothetical protein DUNSADRAFT_11277 [Dunaliella salina]|eukprot:KAF5832727.1 hypothetical protein DUNSADRAFT_11277 [Dunaliella salina]
MKVPVAKKFIDSFFIKLSPKCVPSNKENEGSAAKAAARPPDGPSPSEPDAVHATKRRHGSSSNGSGEPMPQSSSKRQCVPSSEPPAHHRSMVDLTGEDREEKQQEMKGFAQPELQQEQQLQQQGSQLRGDGTAGMELDAQHGIEEPTFPREKGHQGQEAHQHAVRVPGGGAPEQELQQQGSGFGCSGTPTPPWEPSPASHHCKRRDSNSTATTPSTPTATTNSSGKQRNGASSRDRQDGQEQAHAGVSPPEEQKMSVPQDQDAAASETKNLLQNRPQLLADVQQQIQDVRAALGQELLLPCPLPQEPHRADQQAAAVAIDQGHNSLQLDEVAAFVEGQRCNLSALVEQLLAGTHQQQPAAEGKDAAAGAAKCSAATIAERLPEGHERRSSHGEGAVRGDAGGGGGASSSSGSHSAEAVGRLRTQLVDLATRKSYATKDAGLKLLVRRHNLCQIWVIYCRTLSNPLLSGGSCFFGSEDLSGLLVVSGCGSG